MRNAVCLLMLVGLGCGVAKPIDDDICGEVEAEDMAIPKIPVSWPMTGGLDTAKSPLAVQPGSHLTLDNVIQCRLNEWRKRNGFTRVDLDTLPEVAPYFVGRLGDSGVLENGQYGMAAYSPSLSSGRWTTPAISAPPQHRSRKPLFESSGDESGFARAGNMVAVGAPVVNAGGGSYALTVRSVDVASGATVSRATATLGPSVVRGRVRGAATADKLVITVIDNDASAFGTIGVWAYVIDAATGAIAAPVLIKAIVTSVVSLDVMSYGGATITLAIIQNGGTVRHIEYNPSTGALATDVVLAGVVNSLAISLLSDADASGVRAFVHTITGNQVRVVRFSSAGAVLTDDLAEALGSFSFSATGVLSGGGANWNIIYDAIGNVTRIQNKTGGVVGTATNFQNAPTWDGTFIASQAWRDPLVNGWSFLLGTSPPGTTDPQQCYTEILMPLGAGAYGIPVSSPVSLAASNTATYSPHQVVRTAAFKFSMVLPVQVVYEDNAGVIVRHYSLDLFEQTYLTSADDAVTPTQKPFQYKQTSYIPAGQISYYDNGTLKPLGTPTPPRQVSAVASTGAGALTALAEYGCVVVVEDIDADGNIWRSPPSVPLLVTLTGTQNTITWTYKSWAIEPVAKRRVAFYRTAGNGSSYRRIYSTLVTAGPDVIYIDLLADTAMVNGQVLYTEGETPTELTPPAVALWGHDDRLWAAHREYGTEVWYTKNLRPGRQPEFTDVGIIDLDDEFGDVTNGASLDTENVVFKKNAIYFGSGDGFTDSGSGQNYRFDRIEGDEGSIPGSPIVNTGNVVYFVSERGIRTVDKQGVVAPQEAVDQYLNQPLVQAPETVLDGCFVNGTNEVVFLTTNYLLIHDLRFNYWRRVPGLAGMRRCLVISGQLVLFRNDGTVWREGDHTQTTDNGVPFVGTIRSPWMRPTQGSGGPGTGSTATAGRQALRVYRTGVTYTRTSGGSSALLKGRVYRDNDDTKVEEFRSDAIKGGVLSGIGEMVPRESKCTSFSTALDLVSNDVTLRVDGFSAIVGLRNGSQVTGQGDRWK